MKSVILPIALLAFISSLASVQSAATLTCGAVFNGTYVDLSTLNNPSGRYTFTNVTGDEGQAPYTYEIQICGPVTTAFPSICTFPNSAVNRIDPKTNTCISMGSTNATGWGVNLSLQGVHLTYYAGADIDHVQKYTSRVYFECGPPGTNIFNFEHLNEEYNQLHLSYVTPKACPASGTPVTTTTTTTGSTTTTGGNNNNQAFANCGTYFNGTYVDLSHLYNPNGSYVFTNDAGDQNQTPYTYEIQVCGNVKTNFPSACTTPSAANRINPTTGECQSIGDANSVTWEINPDSLHGVHLYYWHGDLFDNVYEASTAIYFECTSLGVPDGLFIYEHQRPDLFQFHFLYGTKYACPQYYLTTTGDGTTTTGAAAVTSPTFYLASILFVLAFLF
eukprot:TRINITY_DN2735_c0_g1_i1.p1 TRINITY_DN2735_c0_g1~~TRINITY_DN2735_c0_g1_i1.p1  ORF type:complete len:389 (+),score=82.46 TRINITY_DN2735_c0_g1_i1:139-1305(+)